MLIYPSAGAGSNPSDLQNWASSPLYQFDCFSPGDGSNMSFTLTSPPCQIPSYDVDAVQQAERQTDHLNSSFSPSIFSPKEKHTYKLPKKRDLYRESDIGERNGIADVCDEQLNPGSIAHCENSRSSLDLPQVLAL